MTLPKNNNSAFLQKQNNHEDKILSQITQLLYAYNITLDLNTGKYTLITGTGMERTVEYLKENSDYNYAFQKEFDAIHPLYKDRLANLLSIENLRESAIVTGHLGTIEYPVLYENDEEYEWHEINVFSIIEEGNTPIINILGRDITKAHNLQERKSRELQAAANRNQVLSDLTKLLYSYNITMNLNTGKFSLIEGTGMTKFVDVIKASADYSQVYEEMIKYISPDNLEAFTNIASIDALRAHRDNYGFIGSMEYGALTDKGEEWHEINIFIITNEFGEPTANILGRDLTEAHKRQQQRELEQKAAMARDQLLSGVTKLLYSFNITINLNTWKYSLITGTGCEHSVGILQNSDDYYLVYRKIRNITAPEFKDSLDGLCGTDVLKNYRNRSGFIGSVTVEANTPQGIIWQEFNLFMGTNEFGEPIANILGRDVTETVERQERREKELKASVAKDQILSEITQTLYSFNITVNLETGKYTLITGTGMEETVAFFESSNDYNEAIKYELKNVMPEYIDEFLRLLSLSELKTSGKKDGFIGQIEYAALGQNKVEWREANVFLGVNDDGAKIANILGRDVTEAHEKADTKTELEIANKANEAKTSFLFNMSHDIRTPMNAIIGFTELLDKYQENAERRKDYLKKIRESSNVLLSIINNILEMARIEKGSLTLDENCLAVDQFQDALCSLFEEMMEQKGLQFTHEINVEHNYVFADSLKLREVYINILSNAYKYTNPGGKIQMKMQELESDKAGYALYQITISDTGIGMSKDFIPHIYDEFSREHTTTENKVEGTGLGMPIVHKLLDLMGGTISVDSELGVGSTFVITISHKIATKADLPHLQIETTENVDFTGKRILLAEDNELNSEIAIDILNEAGFLVERAENGAVAVEKLNEEPEYYYNLVLMDIQMPVMNGYEATKAIRALPDAAKAGIPIVAMTANAFEEDRKAAFQAGMNAHLAKPIVIVDLLKTLKDIL